MQQGDPAAAWAEILFRVFGVDAALDGVAVQADILLAEAQLLPCRNADLPLDQVQPGHHLGDGVLDLQAGVHLHKVELPVLIQKLDGARVAVIDRLGSLGRHLDHPLAGRSVQRVGGTLLDQLLVLALDRAFALAQADHVAVVVAENLHLDVFGRIQVFLHVDPAVAKGRERLAGSIQVGRLQLALLLDQADAAAAAARTRLNQQREADLLGLLLGFLHAAHRVAAGDNRHTRGAHRLSGLVLVAGLGNRLGARADEGDVALLTQRGKARVLREQAVARVDGLRPRADGRRDDGRHVQVALPHRRRTDAVALVGQADVQRLAVGLRKDRHGGDAHLLAGADDAHGNLAPVGDQNF